MKEGHVHPQHEKLSFTGGPVEHQSSLYKTFADTDLKEDWVVDPRGVYHKIDPFDGSSNCGYDGIASPGPQPPNECQICSDC